MNNNLRALPVFQCEICISFNNFIHIKTEKLLEQYFDLHETLQMYSLEAKRAHSLFPALVTDGTVSEQRRVSLLEVGEAGP